MHMLAKHISRVQVHGLSRVAFCRVLSTANTTYGLPRGGSSTEHGVLTVEFHNTNRHLPEQPLLWVPYG